MTDAEIVDRLKSVIHAREQDRLDRFKGNKEIMNGINNCILRELNYILTGNVVF